MIAERRPLEDRNREPTVVMEVVTDPVEIAEARAQRQAFDRNWQWYQAHVLDIGAAHRGKCICVAGGELFVAETPEEALRQGRAAHPQDKGLFVHYIPKERLARIYALTR